MLELSARLIDAGAAVRVLTHRLERAVPAREHLGTVPVLRMGPFGQLKGVGFRAVPRLGLLLCKMIWRLLCDTSEYDVVLVSGFNFMPLTAVVAGLITRKPCVVRAESPREVTESVGGDSRGKMGLAENSFAIRIWDSLRKRAARKVDRYVAISSEIRAGLERVGIDRTRIIAIPNGIAVGRFDPVSAARKLLLRAQLELPADSLLLIYTGRLALSKGVMMLIDVWRELAPTHPNVHLVIVGTGRGSFDNCERALREFIATHALDSRVTLTGSVTNVHEYLQASDLFVFPSDYEGFGLSILEAMAVGLPMVSTRVGVAAELADRCRFGLLVPPQDRDGFRDALRALVPDRALQSEMGRDAHAAVQAQYSLRAEAQRYIDVFSELTQGRT